MKTPSAKLQLYLTNTLDFSSARKKKNELLLNRKQKKLVELKEKQKAALDIYKTVEEDNKIDLECIFCKNADEG